MTDVTIKTAICSVSDKSGLVEFAQKLQQFGINLLSTGGTFQQLSDMGLDVRELSDYTGFPEMMGGRVKTLHPKVHGGLLGRRHVTDSCNDSDIMDKHGILPIDLVVVNLYPFEETVSDPDCDLATAIENIDIGGPAMLRSAAKNYKSVLVVVDVNDYDTIAQELETSGGTVSLVTRFKLAVKAFEHVARYDAAISNYLGSLIDPAESEQQAFSNTLTVQFVKKQEMRYGENPHQSAALFVEAGYPGVSVAASLQLHGKALSYNNVADTDAALECVMSFQDPACVIVKHANPCGVAQGSDILGSYQNAFSTDPTSAFGGIIAFNRPLDLQTATAIIKKQFVEVIIAPGIDLDAAEVISTKKNIRLLDCSTAASGTNQGFDYKRVMGGLLVQQRDLTILDAQELRVVTRRQPTDREQQDLIFAWKVAKYVKSNAIVYARDGMTIGVGAGQMSRIYSARIAGIKAADEGLEVKGSVMASDAFFPFRDGIDAAAEAGIVAVIQPGGSIRDKEVVEAADEAKMAMMFTGMRHFRH